MMKKRGYVDIEYSVSAEELKGNLQDPGDPFVVVCAKGNPRPGVGQMCTVFFELKDTKVGVKCVRQIEGQDIEGDIVIVSAQGRTPFCKNVSMTFFSLPSIVIDVTEHNIVPTHTHVWGAAVEGLPPLARLPRMLESDPVSVFMAFKKGMVVKIMRQSRGGGVPGSIFYRMVE